MSSFTTCCPQCSTPVTVAVPGTAGLPAFTNTTANFVVPAIGSNVNLTVNDTSWMDPGMYLFTMGTGGQANFTVNAIVSSNIVTVTFLGLTGDAAPGATISLGARVTPVGQPGLNGQNGYTQTSSNFVVPSIGSTVTIAVLNTAEFVVNQNVIVAGPANFLVTAINSTTSMTIQFLGYVNDVVVGTTIDSPATVASAGLQGSNAYTTTTAQFTIPAIGSNVTVAVRNTAWMATGQVVVAAGPATFTVSSIASSTSVVLTFLGYVGDLAPANTIANGSTITPGGRQPFALAPLSASSTTPYTLTTVPGSIGISLTISAAGSYQIFARVNLQYSSAYEGYNGANALLMTVNRTNNTPTALASSTIYPDAIQTAHIALETFGVFTLIIPIYSTTNTNDAIAIQASFANALGAGTIQAVEMILVATPVL
jgi:hypothetical protein